MVTHIAVARFCAARFLLALSTRPFTCPGQDDLRFAVSANTRQCRPHALVPFVFKSHPGPKIGGSSRIGHPIYRCTIFIRDENRNGGLRLGASSQIGLGAVRSVRKLAPLAAIVRRQKQ